MVNVDMFEVATVYAAWLAMLKMFARNNHWHRAIVMSWICFFALSKQEPTDFTQVRNLVYFFYLCSSMQMTPSIFDSSPRSATPRLGDGAELYLTHARVLGSDSCHGLPRRHRIKHSALGS